MDQNVAKGTTNPPKKLHKTATTYNIEGVGFPVVKTIKWKKRGFLSFVGIF